MRLESIAQIKDRDIEKFKESYGEKPLQKLRTLPQEVIKFVVGWIQHCNPDSVFVKTDSEEGADYIRRKATENGEEEELNTKGHTVHFDGPNDQARDKKNTKYLLPNGRDLGDSFKTKDRQEGLEEIHSIMEGIMGGKEAFVGFFSLGPKGSDYSIPAIQITDSAYVMHSEDMLYRRGYEKMKGLGDGDEFFKFLHSAGELDENNTSKDIDKRRVYIDLSEGTVYSSNTQYGGNTIGLKKLAMRLAIDKCDKEGWLTEHMFIMGCEYNGKKHYFTGAFPSGCGKTSTAMLPGESLVGDDIAYLRKQNGEARAVNPERGIFGIIRGVSEKGDPIWKALNSSKEAIFSNVLVSDREPYWIRMGEELPEEGRNFQGKWWKGKKDENGNEVPPSHPNARYTLRISDLENKDSRMNDPEGVKVDGIIYGGRDSDTWVPVKESFSWEHGILTMAACLESETTSATLGKSGVRNFNPASNMDFLVIPIGDYLKNNLEFGEKLQADPPIFAVNYFLKNEDGDYLNGMKDKKVWLKWMALRSEGKAEAIETPVGYIPRYEDLRELFQKVLDKEYSREGYRQQFTLRIPEHLEKIQRMRNIYGDRVQDPPRELYERLDEQERRLKEVRERHGSYVPPEKMR